ncbi:hypothetical protein jhhlp_006659 [Lomentospora prolificans]|uniref:non-specific serine/threonine protein kinase n=1 Tax=Lomentospora prolificans TaxID=41688 RepID=A0A2N3N6L2_9PEZI|nr:hypothetical protein jhhlp_006659 [Lomentospora prolificans]
MMAAYLQTGPLKYSTTTRQKAINDARKVQASVEDECLGSGKDPPPYTLLELIGKGTFGRVYKATSKSGQAVAVKIISIEEGDFLNPKRADTFSDILKEVNTLKLLGTSGAKNVNIVLDALLFGQTMWMVTEYCAGGSVATLMRPTGGLPEKWIIPILREVAVAIYWVHKHGIIHRDIKCANVLVTADGQVQLCDFGVAGIMETKFDKRSTVTGTLQWMAPELFETSVAYGTEVDIWAFGSMAFEVATGLPPNATTAIDPSQFGTYLKQHCPRLEGDRYSQALKDLVAFCMVDDPKQRPTIEMVQRHRYIINSEIEYPTASLSKLVNAYRLWESQGGNRQSLFAAGGAQGPLGDYSLPTTYENEEWNFGFADDVAAMTLDDSDTQAVYDAYGSSVDLSAQVTNTPQVPSRRRRKPPPNLRVVKAPLEKIFDPNTISNYEENVKNFYQKQMRKSSSDLPLRDDTQQSKLRESLIDLDASFQRNVKAPQLDDLETIRPGGKQAGPGESKMKDANNRRTQDWIFPVMSPVSPGFDRARFRSDEEEASIAKVYEGGQPTPRQNKGLLGAAAQANRVSAVSLIDLDESLATDDDPPRPSTSDSDSMSVSSDPAKTPFDLERHSIFIPSTTREPSIYVSFDGPSKQNSADYLSPANLARSLPEKPLPEFPVQEKILPPVEPKLPRRTTEPVAPSAKPLPVQPILDLPMLPLPPAVAVMEGFDAKDELKDEFRRLIESMNDHLKFVSGVLDNMPVVGGDRLAGKGGWSG